MVITTSPLVKTYTLQEFWDLPDPSDHSKLELNKGVLYIGSSTPTRRKSKSVRSKPAELSSTRPAMLFVPKFCPRSRSRSPLCSRDGPFGEIGDPCLRLSPSTAFQERLEDFLSASRHVHRSS